MTLTRSVSFLRLHSVLVHMATCEWACVALETGALVAWDPLNTVANECDLGCT